MLLSNYSSVDYGPCIHYIHKYVLQAHLCVLFILYALSSELSYVVLECMYSMISSLDVPPMICSCTEDYY